jgi:hypothetical protein
MRHSMEADSWDELMRWRRNWLEWRRRADYCCFAEAGYWDSIAGSAHIKDRVISGDRSLTE